MNLKCFLSVTLLVFIILSSCKKKDNNPAPAAQASQTPSPSLTWQATTGVTSRTIYRFCVSGNAVFAADGGSIFKSTNEGATWNFSSVGIIAQSVYDVKSIGTTLFASSSNGVYVSNDGGSSWLPPSPSLSGVYVVCLATQDSTLLAGTQNGVFTSNNNAGTWNSLSNGIPANTSITGLASNGTLMLAIGHSTTSIYSLYRSTNSGANWNVVTNIIIPASATIYYVFINGSTCFVGTTSGNFISTDSGNNWSLINSLSNPVIGFCAQGNKIYALCTNSPYVSTDNGMTFTMINNTGLNAYILRAMITTANYIMVSNNADNVYRKSLN